MESLLCSHADGGIIDGFFDAGMLLQALKSKEQHAQETAAAANVQQKREVGKKLRLMEY